MAKLTPAPLDPYDRFRSATPARIGLGITGQALPTTPMLALQHAHARARDAVHARLDVEGLSAAFGQASVLVDSAAPDRANYLRNPGLGRRLGAAALLPERGDHDLAIVVADGLSASAVNAHAAPLHGALIARLEGWRLTPVILVRQGRVAIGDEIGERRGARAVVVLIGERPGLSAADSMSAYITWGPRVGRADSERNCVSNIRTPLGLAPERAADTIAWLLGEARRLGFTGVDLKDRRTEAQALGSVVPGLDSC